MLMPIGINQNYLTLILDLQITATAQYHILFGLEANENRYSSVVKTIYLL